MRTNKPNGLSQQEAVCKACEDIGGVSSLSTMLAVAEKYYGGPIAYHVAGAYRTRWRKSKGIDKDCRTYKGQPRRNMLNDNKVSKGQKQRLDGVIKTMPSVLHTILYLVGDGGSQFHSVKQLRNALQKAIIKTSQQQFVLAVE